MAQTGRDIKRRMNTIRSIQQITKAMEMVAASKLRQAQKSAEATRPYFARLQQSLSRALAAAERVGEELPPIARSRQGDRHCLVVVTSERGLAGGYNANILRRASEFTAQHPKTMLVVVGRKARDYFRRRNRDTLGEFVNLGDNITTGQAHQIGQMIYDFYVHDLFDKASILYTRFINTVTHRVELRPILPIGDAYTGGEQETQAAFDPVYFYEPSLSQVIDVVVPLLIDAAIFQSLMEAKASEFGARMTAMRNASDNAGELIKELTLSFNRARQAAITKEIAEIVGGADALERVR
ncbi:MAG: ATP synthase F1 subunit gamma [Firmicutes bacterium]|nr:ATP synthase F1 subunit gamma [Bacillota bacterium]